MFKTLLRKTTPRYQLDVSWAGKCLFESSLRVLLCCQVWELHSFCLAMAWQMQTLDAHMEQQRRQQQQQQQQFRDALPQDSWEQPASRFLGVRDGEKVLQAKNVFERAHLQESLMTGSLRDLGVPNGTDAAEEIV